MKNKKSIITISLVALVMLLGTTYAFFSYTRIGTKESQLIAGNIYLHFNETGDSISLTNVLPESDSKARSKNNNYITFTIDGVNTTQNKDIYYEILLNKGSEQSGKTRLADDNLKFDLIETTTVDGVQTKILL